MTSNEIKTQRKTNEILNSPVFNLAADTYVRSYLSTARGFRYAVKLTSDEGRYLISLKHTSMILSPRSDEERTARALQNFAMSRRVADKSRVSTWLALAHLAGYVTIQKSDKDRRMKLYHPTEKYRELARNIFNHSRSALQIISPDSYGTLETADDEFIGQAAREGVEVYLTGRRLAQMIRNLNIFSMRDGGQHLLVRMLEEAQLFSATPANRIALPFGKVAREFGISRSQVQKTMALIEEAGLIKLVAKGGKDIALTPSFEPFAREVVAGFLASSAVSLDNILGRTSADAALAEAMRDVYARAEDITPTGMVAKAIA